ncbi:hypothetical protein [Chroococcidiopsis sp.]|uniref:hypothetical protein n=1 Tax=Chroococcidiopsis sp. TaxID=3088168 RepID=UPI003F3878C5
MTNAVSDPYLFPTGIPARHPVLSIDPKRFLEAYNLDVSQWVERNKFREGTQKTGDKILYLSHAHALRLMRQHFPELETGFVVNPVTGGYFFEEIGGGGFFCKPYVHDGFSCSAIYHFGVLSQSGASVFPHSKDKSGNPSADEQLFNRSFYRAQTKAIALTTGIGLKLWTGDDLSEDIIDDKLSRISAVEELAIQHNRLATEPYLIPALNYMSSAELINSIGKDLQARLKELKQDVSNV